MQSFSQVRELVEEIRRHAFRSLSFDLISGLPHQDVASMQVTIDRVLELKPDRVACYSYAHLPERFASQRAIDRLSIPGPEQRLHLQTTIASRLQEAGYQHIGLDHYALPGVGLAVN